MALHLSGRMNKPASCVQRSSKPQRLQPVCATPGGFFTGKSGRAGPKEDVMSRDLAPLLINNREWSKRQQEKDPGYFERLSAQQAPEYLWLGCADSRVPANVVIGLEPGEVFVQRNVGNQALHTDMNCMACIEFSVKALKVKSIIVCGHYNCGAVKASLRWPASQPGLTNMWISDIREARNQHIAELYELEPDRQVERLCEINVMRQVFHVCTSSAVQEAWKDGQPLSVYGVIYSLKDGILTELVGPLTGNNDIEMDQAKFEDRSPGGPIKLSGSANPLDTRAMAEKLALHNTFV